MKFTRAEKIRAVLSLLAAIAITTTIIYFAMFFTTSEQAFKGSTLSTISISLMCLIGGLGVLIEIGANLFEKYQEARPRTLRSRIGARKGKIKRFINMCKDARHKTKRDYIYK